MKVYKNKQDQGLDLTLIYKIENFTEIIQGITIQEIIIEIIIIIIIDIIIITIKEIKNIIIIKVEVKAKIIIIVIKEIIIDQQ